MRGPGAAWGHHQSTRDEKIPWRSYLGEAQMDLCWYHAHYYPNMDQSDMQNRRVLTHFMWNRHILAHNPPLKSVWANAASKGSASVENTASIRALTCKMVQKQIEFYSKMLIFHHFDSILLTELIRSRENLKSRIKIWNFTPLCISQLGSTRYWKKSY